MTDDHHERAQTATPHEGEIKIKIPLPWTNGGFLVNVSLRPVAILFEGAGFGIVIGTVGTLKYGADVGTWILLVGGVLVIGSRILRRRARDD